MATATLPNVVPRPKRGRPRAFDVDVALAAARALFLVRGYDRVTLSDLTGAMGINPPSFYAAYGNKAMLFARIADHYAREWIDEIRTVFAESQHVDTALIRVLAVSVRRFATEQADGGGKHGGCVILEAANNCSDAVVTAYLRKQRLAIAATLYRGVSATHPEKAVIATDQMMTLLAGLSAMARDGTGLERLEAIAASLAVRLGDA